MPQEGPGGPQEARMTERTAEVLRVSPESPGWVPEALAAIREGRALDIVVTGKGAGQIAMQVHRTAASLPLAGIMGLVTRAMPVVGQLPVDPTTIVPVLAGIGALGGAAGMVAFVASVGVTRGCLVAVTFDLGNALDPTDDTLVLSLRRP